MLYVQEQISSFLTDIGISVSGENAHGLTIQILDSVSTHHSVVNIMKVISHENHGFSRSGGDVTAVS